jgi:hypothetical protein
VDIDTPIKKAIQAHRVQAADEVARMAPLSDLLAYVCRAARLRALCSELTRTRRFIEYAYLHNNGFFVLYLADPDLGIQVRLHIWAPGHPPAHEQPHRHRMGFVSQVLTGVLRSTVFERSTLAAKPTHEIQQFQELRIHAPASSDFAASRALLEPGTTVGLRPIRRLVHRAGETYRLPASNIHRVDTPDPLGEPVITLTVWEPPFQPSIAYEPLPVMRRAQTSNVRRLTTAVYDEMLELVLDTTKEPA